MHVGIPREEVLGGVFRLVESSRVNEVDDAVRRVVEALILRADRGVRHRGAASRARAAACSVAACSAAARSAAAASSRGKQHRLYFWPLPQGQGSLRPILAITSPEARLYTSVLTDATLFDALIAIDQELAATAQAGGCRLCAGRLDHADYPRKPRGGPATLSAAYETRASFCCDVEGCRKRLTPASVRFLGRKVYLGAVVLLACALRQGPTPWRVSRLHALLGVSARTLARWHRWWRDDFVHTAFWRAARSRFARPVEPTDLPRGLLARFDGDAVAQVVAALRVLSPLTTTSAGTLREARG